MSRNRGVVAGLVIVGALLIGGGVVLLDRLGSLTGSEPGRGGTGASPPPVNAKIVDLDGAAEPEGRPDAGTPPQPAGSGPAARAPVQSSAGAGGGTAATPVVSEVAPAACSASLLQSILGLGVTLLGGRPAC